MPAKGGLEVDQKSGLYDGASKVQDCEKPSRCSIWLGHSLVDLRMYDKAPV